MTSNVTKTNKNFEDKALIVMAAPNIELQKKAIQICLKDFDSEKEREEWLLWLFEQDESKAVEVMAEQILLFYKENEKISSLTKVLNFAQKILTLAQK